MKHSRSLLAAVVLACSAAAPAFAQDEPRFCPNRPSLGSSACTVEPGRVLVEASAVDWQLTDDEGSREDRVIAGDLLLRTGLGPATELQLGWTAFGHVLTRDKAAGGIESTSGVGDVRVALRQNLHNPDGKGLSFGVEPFVTVPVGREPIGDGDWSAGVTAPVGYEVTDALTVQLTPEVEAAVDEDGNGRHLSYSGILGLGYDLTEAVTATVEVSLERDDDPLGGTTEALAAGSLAWQPRKDLQLDVLAVAGLNHDSPDVRLVAGFAKLF